MNDTLTPLAEFRDKNLERAFFDDNAKKSLKYVRYITLISGVIYLLFFISDYLFLKDYLMIDIVVFSLIPRFVVLSLAVILFVASKRIKNYNIIFNAYSVFVLLIYVQHLITVAHFSQIVLVFEVLDVVLVISGLYFIPNRWVINLFYSIMTYVLFLFVTPLNISDFTTGIGIILTIYFFWFILIVSVLLLKMNTYKRVQYGRELELEKLSQTDALTQSHNRKACDEIIKKLCNDNSNFSLILFDIDDFKKINDTHGHIVGDEVLIKITSLIRENIRSRDLLARWGGEEFIVLLYGTSLQLATDLAQRLCELIASIKIQSDITVTASFGVTEYAPGDNLHSIISRADKLLYSAKANGKNEVCSN